MSSILRALKKLENEPRHLEENRPLDSKFVPLADTSPQKTSANLLIMVIGGGVVCGLVILGGWWLLSEKAQVLPVAQQNISRQSLQQEEKAPVPPRESETAESVPPPAEMPVPQKTAELPPGPTPATTPLPRPAAIAQPVVMPVEEQAVESAFQAPATGSPGPDIIEQAPAADLAPEVIRAPEVPAVAKAVAIPVLNDPEMKLQAITWSKDPQKRIAVINNRILRQGDAVYGYRLDTINQDDVVLSDGGEKWKLLFRIN